MTIKNYKLNHLRNETLKLLFVLPAVAFLLFIVVIPLIRGIMLAFTDWSGVTKTYHYIGFDNFKNMLIDPSFGTPIKNTLLYTAASLLLVNAVGLFLAVLTSYGFKGSNTLRTIFFMPVAVSIVLSSIMWTYIYLDIFPKVLGIQGLLGQPSIFMLGIILMSVWRDSGFAMVIYYAALKGIPNDMIEASIVDGANSVQRFKNIVLPMIRPAVTINVMFFLGWGLKVFEQIMVSTGGGGGPARCGDTFAIYVYRQIFQYNKLGYGQAIAVVFMAIVYIMTFLTTSILKKREIEI